MTAVTSPLSYAVWLRLSMSRDSNSDVCAKDWVPVQLLGGTEHAESDKPSTSSTASITFPSLLII